MAETVCAGGGGMSAACQGRIALEAALNDPAVAEEGER